jgi:hypothetical protein
LAGKRRLCKRPVAAAKDERERPPAASADCSIFEGAVIVFAVLRLLLADTTSHGTTLVTPVRK